MYIKVLQVFREK